MNPLADGAELEAIIAERRLSPVFQPIFDLSVPRILGYEALIRGPADSGLHNPITLFEAAFRHGCISGLEVACREVCCVQFHVQGLPGKLFLNVSPMSLTDHTNKEGATTRALDELGIATSRVVIEISEQYPADDFEAVRVEIDYNRGLGYEIAIDDLGAGYSGLKIWSQIKPEYVKIDRHFIENLHDDPVKREFVRSIQEISRTLGCKVIAEGIETRDELSAIRSIGITFGQGYLLGRPLAMPARAVPRCLASGAAGAPYRQAARRSDTVADMIDFTSPLCSDVTLQQAADIFQNNRGLLSMPVVNDSVPVGIVLRRTILEMYLSRYGRELYSKQPVVNFMEKVPVVVEHDATLEEASRVLTDDPDQDIGVDFIVVQNGRYLGTGKVRRLLQRITERQIRSARYANPLTLLPGNVPIYEYIDDLLTRRAPFHVAYFDINDFKPYNDKYGYSRGDEVIIKLAEVLLEHMRPEQNLVGHIGGDDFVVIFSDSDWNGCCENVMNGFKDLVPRFYDPQDRERGGIQSTDRRGEKQFFPMLSVAIGVISPDCARCVSHHDVAALAADAKHSAKLQGGNVIFVSRRRGPGEPRASTSAVN